MSEITNQLSLSENGTYIPPQNVQQYLLTPNAYFDGCLPTNGTTTFPIVETFQGEPEF